MIPIRRLCLMVLLLSSAALWARGQGGDARAKVSAVLNQTAIAPGQEVVIAVVLDIGRGFHAQSNKPRDPNLIALTVTPDANPGVRFAAPIYPAGHDQTYPGLGTLNVYTGKVIVYVPAKIAQDAKAGPMKISGRIRYQICDDKVCFPPARPTWSVETTVVEKGQPTPPNSPDVFKDYKPPASPNYQSATATPATTTRAPPPPAPAPAPAPTRGDPPAGNRAGAPPIDLGDAKPTYTLAYALGIAFVVGIIFNVMPCVLPVLPLKAMGFYEVAQHDRVKTMTLAGAFSLGIIAVFGVLAVLIVVLKAIGWSELFSKWWFAWSIILLLFVLSLSMFGVFTVNVVPSALYSFTPRHDTYTGNFLFGILAAVLSTPCTAPLLPTLIIWAQDQAVVIGVASMLMVGVGMAFPYIVLSAFPEAARKFPRVGPWSELVKQMMGFLLLGSAVFFAAGQLIRSNAFWWAIVPVAGIASLYLLARTVQLSQTARSVAIASVLAVLMTGSTIYLAAASDGSASVQWEPYSEKALERARDEGKIVLIKFTAHWCLNCQAIEAAVYNNNAETAGALGKYGVVALKADLTDENAPGWPKLKQLNRSGGIPLTAIYVPDYEEPVQLTSIYKTATLVKVLEEASKVAVATR